MGGEIFMMTDRDLEQALNIVLERTAKNDGSMRWTRKELTRDVVELVGDGIPGYRVKVIEDGRRYFARIARIAHNSELRVVGALTEQSSKDARQVLEPLAFAIFREAVERSEGEELENFAAAAGRSSSTPVDRSFEGSPRADVRSYDELEF